MKNILKDFEPKNLFDAFEQITRIPHPSYNTAALADYILDYAAAHGVDAHQDGAGNVIATLPASKGHEAAKPVILQAHLDMVADKVPDSPHDFTKDPLILIVRDDNLYADGTTLGADDGAGIAMCLAIMAEPGLVHPKLYMIFTVEEEVGMDGAYALNMTPFADAASMINLDSENEGEAAVGCAGGAKIQCVFPLRRVKAKGLAATITLSGLAGGHSGDAIDQFGLNANVAMGQILATIGKTIDFSIIDLNGGTKENAIPTACTAKLMIGPYERLELDQYINALQQTLREIAGARDRNLALAVTYGENKQQEAEVLGPDSEALLLYALTTAPNGVQAMGRAVPGAVDTSLNLGIAATEGKRFTMTFNVRSVHNAARDLLCDRLINFADYLGGRSTMTGQYPAWPSRADSPLFNTMDAIWQARTGAPLKRVTIHGGLECSLFADKLPNLDIVSIGPDNMDIHTPNEHMSIPSFKRTYAFLCETISALA